MQRPHISIILCMLNILTLFVDRYIQAQSPCPGVFDYQNDGVSVYGVIWLNSDGPVSSVHTRANFTVAGKLFSNYIGKIETIGDERFVLQKFNRGEPLTYRVHFPVISPLPRLTSLVVNGNALCYGPGDIPGPNQYVTTISLDHILYLRDEQFFGVNRYEPRPKTNPQIIGDFGGNAQTVTINDIDNNRVSWDSNIDDWPDYLYPEQTTKAPRPQFTPRPSFSSPPFERHPQEILTSPPRLPAPVECGTISGGNERVPLIRNGQTYPRGDWPWLVALYRRKEGSLTFICAGTLVSDRHVITAAHCMQQKSKISTAKDIVVKLGVYNLEDWGDEISVTRTLVSAAIHESYVASTLENDLLVVTFDKRVDFNTYIRPACLWSGNTDLNWIVGESGVVAGWGSSEIGPSGQGEPRMVRVPVVSTASCRASKPEFHKLTSAKTLCAGDRKGSGPCNGDSGGGLYILQGGRWRLRGVVSLSLRPQNGESTCNLNEYIVFTDTAQYLPWIRSVMSHNFYEK